MAWYNWVDDANITNIESEVEFQQEQQRLEGFKAGDVASARIVNTGLRQANLVACALMDSLGITDKSIENTVAQVSASITQALNLTGYLKLDGTRPMNANLVPSTNQTYDLGTSEKKWSKLHVDDIDMRSTTSLYSTLLGMKTTQTWQSAQINVLMDSAKIDKNTEPGALR